jgi:hypothetical protein
MRVILLSPDELNLIIDNLSLAEATEQSVRVADDGGSLKVKIGCSAWSPPLGVVEGG